MSGVAWFVDGGYAFECWRNVAPDQVLDYARLRYEIEDDAKAEIEEAYYFGADNDPPSAKQDSFHKAISVSAPDGPGLRLKIYWLQRKALYWPEHLGGHPVMHPEKDDLQYELKSQKAVDVGLAFHLMRSYTKRKWNRLYLVAGDGDFHEVVQHLVEDEDVRVTIIGQRGTISSELAPYCRTIYLEDYVDRFTRGTRRPSNA